MELLRLEKLTRTYGSFVALEADDVTLPPGVIGLLGPNGAGKSTLLKVLLGLMPPTSGNARLVGLDVRTQAMEIRARVGYLSEAESFVPGLKAVEFVALAGEVAGMPQRDAHRRAHEVLAYLGVEEARYRKVEDQPTGVKQRIQLAQALVHDPELLILDEPTNGLDPAGRRSMLALIRTLHDDFKKSVILSSHLLDDVDRVCDSILIIDRGRVLAHGRIDVLRSHLRNRYRLKLLGPVAAFAETLRSEGASVREELSPGSEEIDLVVEIPEGYRPGRLLELLGEASRGGDPGPALRGLVPDEEKLQEIFQRIMAGQSAPVSGAAAQLASGGAQCR